MIIRPFQGDFHSHSDKCNDMNVPKSGHNLFMNELDRFAYFLVIIYETI